MLSYKFILRILNIIHMKIYFGLFYSNEFILTKASKFSCSTERSTVKSILLWYKGNCMQILFLNDRYNFKKDIDILTL